MSTAQMSDPVDPLSDFSLISLFPRTFNQCSVDSGSDLRCNDFLDTAGTHLKSMALKSPNRFLEQAKCVLDGGPESLNVQNLGSSRDDDNVGDLLGVNQKNPQGRRPALGRKRARFSLKQNSSQSVECLEPLLDIDKLLDPEEFFSAFEKHENAKNELKRQRGTSLMELDQNVPSMAERRRRPGLLRKSASYKHHFSVAPSSGDKIFSSSQETFSQEICSSSNDCLQTESIDQNALPSTRELSGSVAATIDRPNDISDQLQSRDDDDDDESDEILELLQERFKPIELKKTCLPDMSSVHRSEFKTLGETLQDSHAKMSHLHGIVGKETTLGCNSVERSSDHPPKLLPPPKSPYASISLLKAQLFRSRQAKDPFSALDIDLSPLGKAACYDDKNDLSAGKFEKSAKDSLKVLHISSANKTQIESGHPTGHNDTGERNKNSPMHENESNIVVSKDTQGLAATELTPPEKSIKGIPMFPAVLSETTMHIELNHDTVECDERDVSPKSTMRENENETVCTTETVMHDFNAEDFFPSKETTKDSSMMTDIALNNSIPHIELDHDILVNDVRGTIVEDNPSDVLDDAVITANVHTEQNAGVSLSEGDAQGPNLEKSNCSEKQSTANAVEDLEKGGPSSDHDKQSTASAIDERDRDRSSSTQAQPFKEPDKASSQRTESKRRKGKELSQAHDENNPVAERRKTAAATKQTRERKEFSRRKSLAACGTQWESGMRRSTRIRTRPLEYWKGERQLYGRIHESLVTVIGTKYFSPTKDSGQPSLKVKSYVPDEYKEIVELAALH